MSPWLAYFLGILSGGVFLVALVLAVPERDYE